MKAGNILFTGVGGQGILLASELTALALLSAGFDAKKSEVHGMAQRGGSVTAQLRFGARVYGPLIAMGTADVQVAFEMMEAVRYLPYLRPNATVVVNTQKILPPLVATGQASYPENILQNLTERKISFLSLDAFEIARQVGESKTANVVMVGALSALLPVKADVFEQSIATRVPARFKEANIEAFRRGRAVST
ncbi:MAG: indolepyruvate oxidoreductase subunit beta [Desulfobulbaceae bacterium]|jgi:indolepyruvate ferredoxin oxidoreductase beta subunit|nr:indolepyruvate oxidoreductase subunit beta [Desulfobulbaceae bacterium]